MTLKKMMRSKKSAVMMPNIAGMISGMMLGFAAACMVKKYYKDKNSLRSRAKKAFRTIENSISL